MRHTFAFLAVLLLTFSCVTVASPCDDILPYIDEFDDPSSGWGESSDQLGGQHYEDGALVLRSEQGTILWEAHAPVVISCSPQIAVAADICVPSGDPNTGILLVVASASSQSGVALLVRPSGLYYFAGMTFGSGSGVAMEMRESNTIRDGAQINRIELIIDSGTVIARANGEILDLLEFDLSPPFELGVGVGGMGGAEATGRIESISVHEFDGESAHASAAEPFPFIDTFDDPTRGWEPTHGRIEYGDGDLLLHVEGDWVICAAPPHTPPPSEFVVEFSAKATLTDDAGALYGIQWGSPATGWHMVAVNTSGFYAHTLFYPDGSRDPEAKWTASQAVSKGQEPNTICVVMGESRAALMVNGQVLYRFDRQGVQPEEIALVANALLDGRVAIRCSDFSVREPTARELSLLLPSEASFPFYDSFDSRDSGWPDVDEGDLAHGYSDGEYRMFLPAGAIYVPATAPFGETYDKNLVFECTARNEVDDGEASQGLWFGYNEYAHYVCEVDSNGAFAVWLLLNGEWHEIIPWTSSEVTGRGTQSTRIRVVTVNTHAFVFLNDHFAAWFRLQLRPPFVAGVCSTSASQVSTIARFDDFSSRQLLAKDLECLREHEDLPVGHLPLMDTFDDPQSGWGLHEDEKTELLYESGQYVVRMRNVGTVVTAWAPTAWLTDGAYVIETTGTIPSEPETEQGTKLGWEYDPTTGFGITLGIDPQTYYCILLDAKGRYRVVRIENSAIVDPPMLAAAADVIRPGHLPNTLQLLLSDGEAYVIVNGVTLGSFPLSLKRPISVGLCATGSSTDGSAARFDHFSVHRASTADLRVTNQRVQQHHELPMRDEFADPNSGWSTARLGPCWRGYDGSGRYVFDDVKAYLPRPSDPPGWEAWAPITVPPDTGFVIHAEVMLPTDNEDAEAALLWGNEESSDYWAFRVSADGYYRVSRRVNDEWAEDLVSLRGVLNAVRTDGAPNGMEVAVVGDRAQISLNGEILETFLLQRAGSSRVGIVGGTFHESEAEVRFESFHVREASSDVASRVSDSHLGTMLNPHPFEDSFENAQSGWPVSREGLSQSYYDDGEYIVVASYNNVIWAPLDGPCPESFVLDTTVHLRGTPDSSEYGLVVGRNQENYYSFRVSPDGTYRIVYSRLGTRHTAVGLVSSDAILPNTEENHLRMTVRGSQASLEINGILVRNVDLLIEGPYYAGVFAGHLHVNGPYEAAYASFSVRELPEEQAAGEESQAPLPLDGTIYSTRFVDLDGWYEGESQYRSWSLDSDGYVLSFRKTEYSSWSWAPVDPVDEPHSICVTAEEITETRDGRYGLVWGWGSDTYYAWYVSTDGFHRVSYKRKNEWQDPALDWERSPAIRTGSAQNQLRVIIEDGEATLIVNGWVVGRFEMDFPGPYESALYGWAYRDLMAVRFTSFAIEDVLRDATIPPPTTDYLTANPEDWRHVLLDGASVEDVDGVRWYVVATPDTKTWSWAPIGEKLPTDFAAELTASMVDGLNNGRHGFVLGTDDQNLYAIRVTAQGYYRIDRLIDGTWDEEFTSWRASRAIHRDSEQNTFRLCVSDEQATLEANGEHLTTFDLALVGPHQIGYLAETEGPDPASFHLLSFTVGPTSETQSVENPD